MLGKLKRSAYHNLSHRKTLSANMGYIQPIACFDVVPGDRIDYKLTSFIRTQPLLAPLMHTVDIDIHAYYSPDRIVWDDYEDFHSGGDDGMDTTVAPYMESPEGGYQKGSLADYLGLPIGVDIQHSALPFRHYAKIRNEFYRDSQLQPLTPLSTASGLDETTSRDLLKPCNKRDYFNTCRPQPQLGPEVTIPLVGDTVPVDFNRGDQTQGWQAINASTGANVSVTSNVATSAATGRIQTTASEVQFDPNGTLEVDLTEVSGVDIRDLREAGAVQRFLEFNNIFGGRLIEQLMARFGVRVPDYRLQIPEFLGAGTAKFQFSEVLQTAEGTQPVGEMTGHGMGLVGSNRFKYKVKEHGWVFVFLIIRPKTQYSQGLPRAWSRQTRFDYLLPEFQHIGDQSVLKKEIYAGAADPDEVFGFNPMYEEYRTIPSSIAGDMHDLLDYWHMGIIYENEPSLNGSFVECNPTQRIFPTTSLVADTLMITAEHTIGCRRLLTKRPQYRLM